MGSRLQKGAQSEQQPESGPRGSAVMTGTRPLSRGGGGRNVAGGEGGERTVLRTSLNTNEQQRPERTERGLRQGQRGLSA